MSYLNNGYRRHINKRLLLNAAEFKIIFFFNLLFTFLRFPIIYWLLVKKILSCLDINTANKKILKINVFFFWLVTWFDQSSTQTSNPSCIASHGMWWLYCHGTAMVFAEWSSKLWSSQFVCVVGAQIVSQAVTTHSTVFSGEQT